MSGKARRYSSVSAVVLCTLFVNWCLSISAAPQGSAAGQGWGEYPRSPAEAARFLEYSTWGPTTDWINHLTEVGYSRFLDEQFAAPISGYQDFPLVPSMRPADCVGTCQRDNYTLYPLQRRFYTNALYGNDQLRQRVAFALHQIIVVSGNEITIPGRFAPYLKVLDRNAFGNYRQLLHDITLNPAMGNYLDMAGNTSTNPNENYAREILQLFSIGVNQLNEDGTPIIGAGGQAIPAYDQDTVNAFARLFTGWAFAAPPATGIANYFEPMVAIQNRHDVRAKTVLQGVTLPPNQTAAKDLADGLDNIFMHPNVGPFVSKQLIQHLVTSNPSPDYVRRVAQVFANNGAGVRGDLAAVVRAVLLDEEAYVNPSPPDFRKGHLKHPILLVTNLLRALGVRSADGLGLSDGYLNPQNQAMGMDLFVPPSVFSYFSPSTGVPGSSLRGPEFGVLNTSTSIRRSNFVNTMVFSRIAVSANAPSGTSLDFSGLQPLASTAPKDLVLRLNTLMMSGKMSQPMFDAILKAIYAVPVSNPLRRAQTAVYLVATSAQYQVAR
ncbi:MAG TPA: DUF1800 domain-containing protein [Terriglobia bacterium]|nr:DUF1800 domain-containing protein [Terriglobia bacterium]